MPGTVGFVAEGAALKLAAGGPGEGDALVEENAVVVPAEGAFVEHGSVAKDRHSAADAVVAVVRRVRGNRMRSDEHGAAGLCVVAAAMAVGIAGQCLQ